MIFLRIRNNEVTLNDEESHKQSRSFVFMKRAFLIIIITLSPLGVGVRIKSGYVLTVVKGD